MLHCYTPSHISAIVSVHTCGTGARKENVMAGFIQLHTELYFYLHCSIHISIGLYVKVNHETVVDHFNASK